MDKPYYSLLPPEARLELLINADYPTILELCNDNLFKDICNSDILWQEKLKREYNIIETKNAKRDYEINYRKDLDKIIKTKEYEAEKIEDKIQEKIDPLRKEMDKEISKIKDKYEGRITKFKRRLGKKAGLDKLDIEIERLKNVLSEIKKHKFDLIIDINELSPKPSIKTLLDEFGKYGRVAVDPIARTGRYIIRFSDVRDAADAKEALKDKYNFLFE